MSGESADKRLPHLKYALSFCSRHTWKRLIQLQIIMKPLLVQWRIPWLFLYTGWPNKIFTLFENGCDIGKHIHCVFLKIHQFYENWASLWWKPLTHSLDRNLADIRDGLPYTWYRPILHAGFQFCWGLSSLTQEINIMSWLAILYTMFAMNRISVHNKSSETACPELLKQWPAFYCRHLFFILSLVTASLRTSRADILVAFCCSHQDIRTIQ